MSASNNLSRRSFITGLGLGGVGASALLTGCSRVFVSDPDEINTLVSEKVPDPIAYSVTRWATDPLARGATSYLGVGATPTDRAALREPINNKIYLAGEAISATAPGTVRGAWESGVAAATSYLDARKGRPGSVVIVGAGAAGIGAAVALRSVGASVVVLEARDRIGGRVWSADFGGATVELGAPWIDDPDTDPVLAAVVDLPADDVIRFGETDAIVRNKGGQSISVLEMQSFRRKWALALEGALQQRGQATLDSSLGEVLRSSIGAEGLTESEQRAFNYFAVTELEYRRGTDVNDLGLRNFDEGSVASTTRALVRGGYASLLQRLATDLDIRLSQTVESIEYRGTPRVKTTTETFGGDAVIVTLPLGTLRSNSVAFNPVLPDAHRNAVGRIGIGTLNAYALQFDRVFWEADAPVIRFLSPNKGEWLTFVNASVTTGRPVLVGYNADRYGRRAELLTDEQVVSAAMTALRTMYAPL